MVPAKGLVNVQLGLFEVSVFFRDLAVNCIVELEQHPHLPHGERCSPPILALYPHNSKCSQEKDTHLIKITKCFPLFQNEV